MSDAQSSANATTEEDFGTPVGSMIGSFYVPDRSEDDVEAFNEFIYGAREEENAWYDRQIEHTGLWWRLFGLTVKIIFVWAVIVLIGGIALWQFFNGDASNYLSSIYLEVSSASLFFAIAPLVVNAGRYWPRATPIVVTIVGGVLLYLAPAQEEVTQSVFIEFGVAVLAVAILEISIARILKRFERAAKIAKTELSLI